MTTPELMSFPRAMKALIDGSTIARRDWETVFFVGLHYGRLRMHESDDLWHDWIVSDSDAFARDWVVREVSTVIELEDEEV